MPKSLEISHRDLDLDEIQSLDMYEIVSKKLRQAYTVINQPVIVEDVSAELASLNGLPGPFVKFFIKLLGADALYQIGAPNDPAKIICTMSYFDGKNEIIVDGVMNGTVVAPRGNGGFGFDPTIIPDGHSQTLAELGQKVKNELSHRRKAADLLSVKLIEAKIY